VWRHAPVTSDIKEDEGGALLESKNVRPACFVSKTRTKQQQTNKQFQEFEVTRSSWNTYHHKNHQKG
jgi:hypothetical protein